MKRKLLCLLLAIGMILSCILPAWATEQEETEETTPVILETVEINSVEDFLTFAQNCTLDSWSQDKIFILNTDVSLAGKDLCGMSLVNGFHYKIGILVSARVHGRAHIYGVKLAAFESFDCFFDIAGSESACKDEGSLTILDLAPVKLLTAAFSGIKHDHIGR